jgi:hypothetical protein
LRTFERMLARRTLSAGESLPHTTQCSSAVSERSFSAAGTLSRS